MTSYKKNALLITLSKIQSVVMRPLHQAQRHIAVVEFLQQLTLLTATGLPLIQCLDILATQRNTNPKMRSKLKYIVDSVSAGKPFGATCAEYPELFSPLMCTVFACSERMGIIHPLVLQLSEYELRERHIQHKILSIWLCTSGVILSVMAVLFLLAGKLIPIVLHNIVGSQLNSTIHESWFILGHYSLLWIIISIVLSSMIYSSFKMTSAGKSVMEYFVFALPVFGDWNRKIMLHRITHMLSLLLASGLSYQDALRTMEIMGKNRLWLSKMLNEPAQTSLSQKFRAIHFFPEALLQLISAGENSKSIADVLQKVADYYAEEIGAMRDALAFVVVPVVILVIGLMFAAVLYSFK